MDQRLAELHAATDWLPKCEHFYEAKPLAEKLDKAKTKREPTLLGKILPAVLARLTGGMIQSKNSEDQVLD